MLNYIVNLIFPPKCIFCGKILELNVDKHICSSCFKKIPFSSKNYTALYVRQCEEHYCDGVICTCEYSGIIREAVKRYKFKNKPSYYRTFGKMLSEKVKIMTNNWKFDIIISIPLNKHRELARGYNQSYLIAKVLSKELGIPECSGLLTRVKDTSTQSLLGRNDRQANIIGAFRVNNPGRVKGKTILLVDDIITTGSTLSECSRALKEAGAKSVIAGVIASGRKY